MTSMVAMSTQEASRVNVLRRVQAIAGTLFAVFLVLHLSNMLLAPLGVDVFNGFQRSVRVFYQYPLIELFLVIGPLAVHIVCAVWLFVLDRRRGKRVGSLPMRELIHRWSGVFLLVFIVGHVAAVRGPSFFYGVYPEFEGLSFSLWFFPAYFYPYYLFLAVAGFYHGSDGVVKALYRLGKIRSPRLHYSVTVIFAIGIMLSLLAFDGAFYPVPDPLESQFGELGARLTGLDMSQPIR